MTAESIFKHQDILLFLIISIVLLLECVTCVCNYINIIIVSVCTLGLKPIRWKKIIGIFTIIASVCVFIFHNSAVQDYIKKNTKREKCDCKETKIDNNEKINGTSNTINTKRKQGLNINKPTSPIHKDKISSGYKAKNIENFIPYEKDINQNNLSLKPKCPKSKISSTKQQTSLTFSQESIRTESKTETGINQCNNIGDPKNSEAGFKDFIENIDISNELHLASKSDAFAKNIVSSDIEKTPSQFQDKKKNETKKTVHNLFNRPIKTKMCIFNYFKINPKFNNKCFIEDLTEYPTKKKVSIYYEDFDEGRVHFIEIPYYNLSWIGKVLLDTNKNLEKKRTNYLGFLKYVDEVIESYTKDASMHFFYSGDRVCKKCGLKIKRIGLFLPTSEVLYEEVRVKYSDVFEYGDNYMSDITNSHYYDEKSMTIALMLN